MFKKVPGLPRRYSPTLKFHIRAAPWNYNSSKFISAYTPLIFLILGRWPIPYFIVYFTVDEKMLSKVKLIVNASKNKKIQLKHKINAPLTGNSKQYNITTNDTILASESFSFRNTGN